MAADCPICGKPGQERFKPFCSKRCADIDLHGWLKGGYSIPGSPVTPQNPTENEPDGD